MRGTLVATFGVYELTVPERAASNENGRETPWPPPFGKLGGLIRDTFRRWDIRPLRFTGDRPAGIRAVSARVDEVDTVRAGLETRVYREVTGSGRFGRAVGAVVLPPPFVNMNCAGLD